MAHKNVVVVGGIFQDIFLYLEKPETLHIAGEHETQHFLLIREGKKETIKALHIALGGGGANVATTCALLGNSVFLCSVIGNDEAGDFVLKNLQKNKINVEFVKKVEQKTAFSLIFPPTDGNSSPLGYLGANNSEIQYSKDIFQKTEGVYCAPLHGVNRIQCKELLMFAKKEKNLTFCNPSIEQIEHHELFENLHLVDILQCNYAEAQLFFKTHFTEKRGDQALLLEKSLRLDFFCKELIEKGVKIIIITNGKEGVYVAHKDTLYFAKSPNIKIKNTVGAGDAFGAAFFCSYLETNSVEEALKSGMTNSCVVLEGNGLSAGVSTQAGATSGLLSRKEFEQKKDTMQFNIVSFKI